MPSPWSSKEGGCQANKSSRYQSPATPTAMRCLQGQALWLPARRGSSWPNLEPFCNLICKFHFQMKEQAAQAHLCRPCLVGQFAPVVVKSSTELKLLGIPFRHSIQMASGCSAQAPPFTHPGTQLTHVGTQPRHRLSPLMFGPFAMKHFV